jgi:isopentenyl diphosphate isomerase/L-lactate dehydrogenase-like FMN-dependent dehydrogenase
MIDWSTKQKQQAEQLLPREVYDFVAGGADDESVLYRNIQALNRLSLIPRILNNVKEIDIKSIIYNQILNSPVIVAPTAPHKLLHPEGEFATAKAAERTKTLMIISCMASESLEKIAQQTKADLWFQLHIFRDRQVTENLIKRAIKAGYKAFVVTIDMPKMGVRRRDVANQFKIPDTCLAANLLEEGLIHPQNHKPTINLFHPHTNNLFDPTCTWDDIKWLQQLTQLPIFLKGILHSADALNALKLGVNGIIVSNHGGRQLGSVVATIEILPQIVKTIDGMIPILVDGGIRSGFDVFKALALGANAVLVGRPILWGLAIGGMEGVVGVLNQLNRELIHAMELCGFSSLKNVNLDGRHSIHNSAIL